MSIDVNDHQRYASGKMAEHVKAAEERAKQAELLAQADSPLANTGIPELDKLIRGVQELLTTCEEHANVVANKGVACIQDEMIRLQQLEYAFVKGKVAAFNEVLLMPAKIVAEAKRIVE